MGSFELTPSPIEGPKRLESEMGKEELRDLLDKKRRQADYDALTDIKNRRSTTVELVQSLQEIRGEGEFERFENDGSPELLKEISLVFIDLDYFKNVNDTFGHLAGDEVLKRVSAFLRDSVRDTDTVGRWGGEEIMIIMRNTSQADAAKKAEELRHGMEQIRFEANPNIKVTGSFGVASSNSSAEESVLIDNADRALRRAKDSGRNRVEEYDEKIEYEPLSTTD